MASRRRPRKRPSANLDGPQKKPANNDVPKKDVPKKDVPKKDVPKKKPAGKGGRDKDGTDMNMTKGTSIHKKII